MDFIYTTPRHTSASRRLHAALRTQAAGGRLAPSCIPTLVRACAARYTELVRIEGAVFDYFMAAFEPLIDDPIAELRREFPLYIPKVLPADTLPFEPRSYVVRRDGLVAAIDRPGRVAVLLKEEL